MDRKLLIFDLDGTLVYAEYSVEVDEETIAVNGKPHFTIPLDEDDKYNRFGCIFVWKRPFVDELLEWAFQNYDVAVWSASGRDYVRAIVYNVFPGKLRDQLKFTWSGERTTTKRELVGCYSNNVALIKNLKKIWKRKWTYTRHNTLILDDTPTTYERNFGNAIPINSWTGNPQDQELQRIKTVLELLLPLPSVRYTEKRSWVSNYLSRKSNTN